MAVSDFGRRDESDVPVYPFPATPAVTRAEVRRAQVPASEVVVDEDTPVAGLNGEELGKVREMFVDPDGRLSHLAVDIGLLSGQRILLAHWIESIRQDQVTLAVGNAALEGLEVYEPGM